MNTPQENAEAIGPATGKTQQVTINCARCHQSTTHYGNEGERWKHVCKDGVYFDGPFNYQRPIANDSKCMSTVELFVYFLAWAIIGGLFGYALALPK